MKIQKIQIRRRLGVKNVLNKRENQKFKWFGYDIRMDHIGEDSMGTKTARE